MKVRKYVFQSDQGLIISNLPIHVVSVLGKILPIMRLDLQKMLEWFKKQLITNLRTQLV